MTGLSETLLHPGIGTGAVVALLGYAVVFVGIILLLLVVTLMGRIMMRNHGQSAAKVAAPASGPAPATAPAPAPVEKPAAKGTAGELKLYDTDPKDAALIMAIVAHRLGKPINELRFRSIKEVKDK